MKTKLSLVFAILLVAGAALASDAPFIDARISSDTTAKQIRDGKGRVTVTFNIEVTNRSDDAVTLTRVDVRTNDDSGVTIRDASKKLDTVIPPSTTEDISLVAKRIVSRRLARTEPLALTVHLTFKGPGGEFGRDYSRIIE